MRYPGEVRLGRTAWAALGDGNRHAIGGLAGSVMHRRKQLAIVFRNICIDAALLASILDLGIRMTAIYHG